MSQTKNNPIIVSGGVRYRASVARRLGLIPNGKVITARSKAKPNPAKPPAAPVTTTTLNPTAQPERPNNGASKALWTEYALSQGITAEQLDGLKRDEIIELVDATVGDGSGE